MKKVLYFASLLAVSLTACTKESSNENALRTEIGLRPMGGAVTRSAINGTAFPQGYDMLVSAFDNTGSSSYFQGKVFSYDAVSDAWKCKNEVLYYPANGSLNLLAVASAGYNTASNGIAPAAVWGESDNVARKVVLTVPDNSTKFDDLLYSALNNQAASAGGAPMVFQHAMTSVVFIAKSNSDYNASTNAGITIDGISLKNAKYSGTLTIVNNGTLTATWSDLGSVVASQPARVWDDANLGTNASESVLSDMHLTRTASTLEDKPFGDAYVILPPQEVVDIVVNYTIHNGYDAGGNPVNNARTYTIQHGITIGSAPTWQAGKKYIYQLDFKLAEVLITPSVVDWENQPVQEITVL